MPKAVPFLWRMPLLWRMILPTVAVSVLLLAVGLGSAIYVYSWNNQVSARLDERVAEILKAEELVLAIRDVRLNLDRYVDTQNAENLREARKAAVSATELVDTLVANNAIAANDELVGFVHQLPGEADHVEADPEYFQAHTRLFISSGPLAAASKLLESNRAAVTEQSRQNRQSTSRIGMSIALLGVCGATAGLLAGIGVARGVSSAVTELGGTLQSLSASLASDTLAIDPAAGLSELVAALSEVRVKTEGMVTELERSRETAARADQLAAVGQLAAGIAHELRNPLTAVKLLTDAALDEGDGLRPNELAIVRDETDRMQQMLQTFLDFARPPKLVRRSVNVGELASQTVELVRRRGERLGVAVELHLRDVVELHVDPQQLRQVLLNLVINAIDAQPNGGRVEVSVESDGETAVVEVADEGPGIADEVAERLFEPFVSTKETGVGLGLAVSQRIAVSHGGRILADDRPGGGAIFRVELPAASAFFKSSVKST